MVSVNFMNCYTQQMENIHEMTHRPQVRLQTNKLKSIQHSEMRSVRLLCGRFSIWTVGKSVFEWIRQTEKSTHKHILFKTAIHWSARIYMEKTDTHKKISQWRDTYIQIQYPLVSFVFSFRVVKQNWTNIDDREREQRCPGWHKRVKKAGKKSKAVRMSKRFSLLCKYRDFDAFSLFGINMSIAVPACIITLKPLMGAHRVQCSLSHCFKYRINK